MMGKRLLSCILTFIMVLSLTAGFPAAVRAANVCEVIAVDSTVVGQYADFGTALNAAGSGETVRLLADISYADKIILNSKSFHIDVDGHVLTVNLTDGTCITASGGYDLLVKDKSGGGALHLNTAGVNACGIYATGSGSTVTVETAAAITITNSDNACGLQAKDSAGITLTKATTVDISGGPGVGVDAFNGSFIEVRDGTVTASGANSIGIRARYDSISTSSGVLFTGDITVSDSGYGVYAEEHGAATVEGDINGGNFGVYALSDASITVRGNIHAANTGAYLGFEGMMQIKGNVTTANTTGYGVRVVSGGQLSVDGNVSGGNFGAGAVYEGSTVSVTGNVQIKALNGYGIWADDGGAVTVGGNVKVKGGYGCGVYASATDHGSKVTVDGTVSANSYIHINSIIKSRTDQTTPTTKPGYLTYTGGTPACSVWVKNLITAFAWVVYSGDSFPTGPVTLKLVNSDTLTSLASVDHSFYMTGADFAGDRLYGVSFSNNYNSGLYEIDPDTGAYQLIGDTGDNLQGFTYDAASKTAYAVSFGSNYRLYKIDLSTGALTFVGPQSTVSKTYVIVDIAADNSGHLYGLDIYNDILVSLNPANGSVTEIGSLGLNIKFAQDIAYDRDNEILYGLLYDDSGANPGIYRINTATGAATKIQGYPYEFDGFAIPYLNTAATSIEITTQPGDATVNQGAITGSLTCNATVSNESTPAYAWYSCDDSNKTNDAVISGATDAIFALPTSLTVGTYYYFCRVSAVGAADMDSVVAKVTVSAPTFTITASAGNHGTISPLGSVSVTKNTDRSFAIIPDYGYAVADVLVDGASSGAVNSYTFHNVTANHTIAVSFVHNCLAKQFKDVDITKWYHEGIDFVLLEGLFKGLSDTAFAPDATMTRAMLVTVLYRLEGEPATTAVNTFQDVSPGQWYTNAVAWASDKGIVKGYSNTTFGTNDPVTREQTATFLYRYAQYKTYDLSAGDSYNLLTFSDGGKVSSYATAAMKWSCATGILKGDNNKLSPGDNSTRAQVATMLMRFVKSTDT